jgi:membrane associated rhomboid family serine protease
MGIYDREYYRGETRGNLWLSGTAPVCRAIIIANVAIFLLEQVNLVDREVISHWFVARSGDIFYRGYVWQLLTATFLHDGLLHLLGNMLFLWFVGREMEAMYGSKDFAAFYFSAAIISMLGWALFHLGARDLDVSAVGASGAVFAVIVLFALYYPRREILFMFVIPLEVWLLVTLYIGYQVLLLLKDGHWGYAVEAHLVGAGYGYLYKRFALRWSHLSRFRKRGPRLRVVSPEPREKPSVRPSAGPTWAPNAPGASKPSSAPSASLTMVIAEEQLDARLDEVLAKIAREGRGGLTEDDNLVLQEASLRARNRRSDRV